MLEKLGVISKVMAAKDFWGNPLYVNQSSSEGKCGHWWLGQLFCPFHYNRWSHLDLSKTQSLSKMTGASFLHTQQLENFDNGFQSKFLLQIVVLMATLVSLSSCLLMQNIFQ